MTQTTTQTPQPQDSAGAELDAVDEQLAARLVAQARERGISLVGPDGLLQRVTKLVLEGALEGELADHLGYAHGDPAGRNGGNSRNGTRAKTVLTEIGRWNSRCHATATPASSPRSCASASDAWWAPTTWWCR
jgi:Transposase, Mutator family